MSKTSQRKRTQYQQGYGDALAGTGFRWQKHPYLDAYTRGYAAGKREVNAGRIKQRRAKAQKPWVMACVGFAFAIFALLIVLGALEK